MLIANYIYIYIYIYIYSYSYIYSYKSISEKRQIGREKKKWQRPRPHFFFSFFFLRSAWKKREIVAPLGVWRLNSVEIDEMGWNRIKLNMVEFN